MRQHQTEKSFWQQRKLWHSRLRIWCYHCSGSAFSSSWTGQWRETDSHARPPSFQGAARNCVLLSEMPEEMAWNWDWNWTNIGSDTVCGRCTDGMDYPSSRVVAFISPLTFYPKSFHMENAAFRNGMPHFSVLSCADLCELERLFYTRTSPIAKNCWKSKKAIDFFCAS